MGLTVTAVGSEKKPSVHELKKHAATIHCSNTLSLLQRKISNALLYYAYKELLIKEEYEINIKQLCHLIAYQGNNHAAIKEALKGLLSTVIEWNVVCDTTGIEDWTASSILASVSLKGSKCYYAYSPRMKQLLYSPSMFGKINLFIQSHFKSSYGLALYENCVRYRGLPYTKWFEMETFRKLMGVSPETYTIFRDFKRRVLDKSIQEVNTYSDLIVESELVREGRQVKKIRFILKERAKKTRLGFSAAEMLDSSKADMCSKLITQFGLSPAQVEKVFQEYNSAFIVEKITLIETSNNYQQGKVQNVAAYFLSALKNNYQSAKTSQALLIQQKQQDNELQLDAKKQKRYVQQIEKAYLAYREKTIDQAIEQLDPGEQYHLMEQFFQYAEQSIKMVLRLQRRKYTEETVLQSPQIKGLLRQYALQLLPALRESLVPLERFLENLSESHRHAWQQLKMTEPTHLLLQYAK